LPVDVVVPIGFLFSENKLFARGCLSTGFQPERKSAAAPWIDTSTIAFGLSPNVENLDVLIQAIAPRWDI